MQTAKLTESGKPEGRLFKEPRHYGIFFRVSTGFISPLWLHDIVDSWEELTDGSETLNPIDKKLAGDFTKEWEGLIKEVVADVVLEDNVDETLYHLAAIKRREVGHRTPHIQGRTHYKNEIFIPVSH